jgi:hypothetical protein
LPQEKVSKFAEMKEPELLKETQKVAGHAKLYEWHEVLIGDGKEKLDLEAKLSHAQRSFKDVEKQVSSLQVEVDRYKERLGIENMVIFCHSSSAFRGTGLTFFCLSDVHRSKVTNLGWNRISTSNKSWHMIWLKLNLSMPRL